MFNFLCLCHHRASDQPLGAGNEWRRRPLAISHLRRVRGGDAALRGAQAGRHHARYGPLGGERGRRVDEGRAVAERRAHHPGLPANELLVHLQGHGRRGVGETQRRAAGGRGGERGLAFARKSRERDEMAEERKRGILDTLADELKQTTQ